MNVTWKRLGLISVDHVRRDGSLLALKPANLQKLDTAQELHASAQSAAATRATLAAAQPAGGAAALG